MIKAILTGLYQRVILSYKSTLLGIVLGGGVEALSTYFQGQPQPWAHVVATVLIAVGGLLKSKGISAPATPPPA